MDEHEYLEIKDRAWEKLSKLPGVHAVGLGTKVIAGSRTNEVAIAVFVVKKKALGQLEADEVVPSTIEGVKTDVVEMQAPRLLQGQPTLVPIVAPLPPTSDPPPLGQGNGAKITLTASSTPPAAGFVVVVAVTLTPLTSANAPIQVRRSVITNGKLTLEILAFQIITAFAFSALDRPILASAPPGSREITIRTSHEFSAAVSCYVLTMDAASYSNDYLRGGVRIQEGRTDELGTLGCLATTAPTPADPRGTVVAITNRHVVSTPRSESSTLLVRINETSTTIAIDRFHELPIPSHNLVFVGFYNKLNSLVADARYTTKQGDTEATIAEGVAEAINEAAISGVRAKQKDTNKVDIAGANTGGSYIQCTTFGPSPSDGDVTLVATVKRAAGIIVVSFSGRVSSPNYGVFLDVHPGGVIGSFGTFVNPRHEQSLTSIADAVAASVNALPPAIRGTIRATPSEATVTIPDAQAIECSIQRDVQVGHPTNDFAFPALGCCTHRVGRVVDARLDLDAAIIRLDPGLKYKLEIEGVGMVTGTIQPSRLLGVQKRGFVSGVTVGEITTVATNGRIGIVAPRFYKNAIVVESTTKGPGETSVRPFMLPGDSGSALVTSGSGPIKVVGLLFGSGDDTQALAMPIERVIDAFPNLGLSFAPLPGQDPKAVQTVPSSVTSLEAVNRRALQESPEREVPRVGVGRASLGSRLIEAEGEITATTVGRDLADLVRRHFAEAQALVNDNRRVATVWQRSGGPELMSRLLEVIYVRGRRLPAEINGRPLADCLSRIQRVLVRYASPAFSKDLARLTAEIVRWSGQTYTELLATLQAAQAE